MSHGIETIIAINKMNDPDRYMLQSAGGVKINKGKEKRDGIHARIKSGRKRGIETPCMGGRQAHDENNGRGSKPYLPEG